MKTFGQLLLGIMLFFATAQAHAYMWYASCTGSISGNTYSNNIYVDSPYPPSSDFSLTTVNDVIGRAAEPCRLEVYSNFRPLCWSLNPADYVIYRVGDRLDGYSGYGTLPYVYTVYGVTNSFLSVVDLCAGVPIGTRPGNRPCPECNPGGRK